MSCNWPQVSSIVINCETVDLPEINHTAFGCRDHLHSRNLSICVLLFTVGMVGINPGCSVV